MESPWRKSFFLTGTDEHGEKIQEIADKKKITPMQLCDFVSARFRQTWENMNITNNYFIRTTNYSHITVVQNILKRLYEKGDIYQGEYEGLYCVGCERYLTIRELTDKGECSDHLEKPNRIKEKNYFFHMEQFRGKLVDHIRSNPNWILPAQYKNEVLNYLNDPLDDLCISRPKDRLTWGIDLPFDNNYVTYVWFDALISYISAIGYPDGPEFNGYWSNAIHFLAKDIIKTHAVYWPTMLMSIGLPLPKHLIIHGYWKSEGQKMSKSLGNVIKPLDMQKKVGSDVFRYYVLKEMNLLTDSDFRIDNLRLDYNADFANNLGNLLSRLQALTEKIFGAVIVAPTEDSSNSKLDKEFKSNIIELSLRVMVETENFQPSKAINTIFTISKRVNKYINDCKPWLLSKQILAESNRSNTYQKKDKLAGILYNAWESIRIIASHMLPFMPEAASKLFDILELPINSVNTEIAKFGLLRSGMRWKKASILYPKWETG